PPGIAVSPGSSREAKSPTRSGGTATTVRSNGTARRASRVRARRGRPAILARAFGSSRPSREPEPAAGTIATHAMRRRKSVPAPSDGEDLFFLRLQDLVDLADLLVRQFLRLLEGTAFVVLGDLLV